MKRIINTIFIIIAFSLLGIPMITMNTNESEASDIDNRMLADNPFEAVKAGATFTTAFDSYIQDRIGFRTEAITTYQIINRRLFGISPHPNVLCGNNGYEFFAWDDIYKNLDRETVEFFVRFVKELQDYCDKNEIAFVFAFEPDKPAVRTELLPNGLNYDCSWVDYMFELMDKEGIRYANNKELVRTLDQKGIWVENHQYDPGHYNDNAAFYSVNNVLDKLKEQVSDIHINSENEYEFSTEIMKYLSNSEIEIDEEVPLNILIDQNAVLDHTAEHVDDLILDEHNKGFGYYENTKRKGGHTALWFQGSHMNSYGIKYLTNAFSEYIHVTSYGNVDDYRYFVEKFKPDILVYEIAQRAVERTNKWTKDYFLDQSSTIVK